MRGRQQQRADGNRGAEGRGEQRKIAETEDITRGEMEQVEEGRWSRGKTGANVACICIVRTKH